MVAPLAEQTGQAPKVSIWSFVVTRCGHPVESAGLIVSNENNTFRQDLLAWRRGAQRSGGERCSARAARRAHRLDRGGALRRHRGAASRRAARDSGGGAALALGAVEARGMERDRRLAPRGAGRALRRGDRHPIPAEERSDEQDRRRNAPWTGPRERARVASPFFLRRAPRRA